MFAIGVGLRDNTELFGIASSKDKVVSLADFDSLRRELKKLTKVICRKYVNCLNYYYYFFFFFFRF